ncbi:MAG: HDOD domain-containing protein [Gammaproteobacteria bacterium]|nr:HDOD domain-containing protein [Gammaproteobacteria bacterium]
MAEIFIARQPIYTRTLHVFAYELLYRADADNHAKSSGDAATTEVLLGALTEIGLDYLVGVRSAFINLTRSFIISQEALPFPGDQLVIELMEDIEPDEMVVRGVQRLVSLGYTIALDDFIYDDKYIPLIKLAKIAKIDIQAHTELELRQLYEKLRKFEHLKLLAEKVETQEQYDFCRELGFNYFQGYFFCRPRIIKRKRMPANQAALMQLLTEVQRTDVKVARLEAMITKDVALSYKLLRYINSAFFGLPRPMESIQRAIVFLGARAIQKWATLLILSRIDDKPNELMVTAVVRGKMCELLAQALEFEPEDACFTVGLLSVLDALLDMPMDRIVNSLTLSDQITDALLEFKGTPGEILRCVLNYERSNWENVALGNLESDVIKDAYLQAVGWAVGACRVVIGE